MLSRIIIAIIAIIFSTTKYALSDGWTQPKNHGFFITSYEMRSFKGLDIGGKFNDSLDFAQSVLNLYGEYGLSKRVTLVGKVIAIDSMFVDEKLFLGNVKQRSIGLDTFNTLLRVGVIRNNTLALSIVGGFGTPSAYKQKISSQFAIKKYKQISGIELGLNLSESDFFTLTLNYHINIKHWYNEFRIEAVYGHFFLENILFMVRFQKFIYYISKEFKNENYNPLDSSVFDYLSNSGFAKITFSIAMPISKYSTFEFGFYSSIKSKITKTSELGMKMKGIYASIWLEF